jgi:alpha-L-rhamnosidase
LSSYLHHREKKLTNMAATVPENQKITKVLATRFNEDFAKKSDELCPKLAAITRDPQRLLTFVPDSQSFFNLRAEDVKPPHLLPTCELSRGDHVILDYGLHMVGKLTFTITAHGLNIDAPCRLRITFGETPLDVTAGMEGVSTWISTSWLPDEIINIDYFPQMISMPRRHACRYIRFDVIDTSPKYFVTLSDARFEAVSSVQPQHAVQMFDFGGDVLLNSIDHASISTLRDCMHTVFEDGPRRDRRMWIGDLRLQALTNYCTFKDYDLVKRSIYMFAAVVREDGSIPACLFEHPTLRPATDYIVDYDALFAVVCCEYVEASDDLETGHVMWDTVCSGLQRAISHLNPESHVFELERGEGWKFLDWREDLDRTAGLHGLVLYCLKAANKLAKILALPPPYFDLVKGMSRAAWTFYQPDLKLFVSGPDQQISIASAAWLVLADVFPTETARESLKNTLKHPDRVEPSTPYLWHYLCESLISAGLFDEAVGILKTYWGGMIRAGADTFWECFDPKDPQLSPYGDVRNNSFCHAWSCTPSHLLRVKLKDHLQASESVSTMDEYDKLYISNLERSLTP